MIQKFENFNSNDSSKKIPTAGEFIDDHYNDGLQTPDFMIEFAKLHVEAALKSISEKMYDTYHTVCEDGSTKGVFRTQKEALDLANKLNSTTDLHHDWNKVVRLGGGMSKDSILNSYSANIK